MKNLLYTFILIIATSCASHPQIDLIVGKDYFNLNNLQREAPYEEEINGDNRSFINLPKNLQSSIERNTKDWDKVIRKYKAECRYFVYQKNGENHFRRWLTKWTNDSINTIKTPNELYEYLNSKGFTDYKVIKEKSSDLGYEKDKAINVILLIYDGVKHEITLRPKSITVESYLQKDKDFWEKEGFFMLDTPIEVFEKYKNVYH